MVWAASVCLRRPGGLPRPGVPAGARAEPGLGPLPGLGAAGHRGAPATFLRASSGVPDNCFHPPTFPTLPALALLVLPFRSLLLGRCLLRGHHDLLPPPPPLLLNIGREVRAWVPSLKSSALPATSAASQVRERNPLLSKSERGILYYPSPREESFTIQVRERNPLLSKSESVSFRFLSAGRADGACH